jgi:BioD-like phosphotransacetylase family protein
MKYFVQGNKNRVGVSTICIGMAGAFNAQGKDVSLFRIGSDEAAEHDAQTFAHIDNVTASSEPISAEQFTTTEISNDGISIIEVPQDIDVQQLSQVDDRKILVSDMAMEIPAGFDGVIRNHSLKPGPNTIVENSILSSTDLGVILDATDARVISSSSDANRDVIETIMIGPISHDATDSSYFNKFQNKLILTRSEKVDLVLGAMAGDTTCILLTGGNEPSPYIIDRLFGNPETTLAITNYTTNEAMEKIGSIVGVQQINSEKKITEITRLFHEAIDLKDFS